MVFGSAHRLRGILNPDAWGVIAMVQRLLFVKASLLGIVLLLSVADPASAYIDGGTTTVLFQTLVAGGAAAALSLRIGWRRLRMLGTRRSDDGGQDDARGAEDAITDSDERG